MIFTTAFMIVSFMIRLVDRYANITIISILKKIGLDLYTLPKYIDKIIDYGICNG